MAGGDGAAVSLSSSINQTDTFAKQQPAPTAAQILASAGQQTGGNMKRWQRVLAEAEDLTRPWYGSTTATTDQIPNGFALDNRFRLNRLQNYEEADSGNQDHPNLNRQDLRVQRDSV